MVADAQPYAPLRSPLLGGVAPGLRSWLRARPRLQGTIVGTSALHLRLPHRAGGVYALLYHGVGADQVAGLRSHLQILLDRGRFLSWENGLAALRSPQPLPGPHFLLTFDDGHEEWTERVLPLLAELNLTATFFIATSTVRATSSRHVFSWDHCKRLVDAGMVIGSHSVTHARLAPLDARSAEREIAESKDLLQRRLGIEVKDFSLPYGLPGHDYSERDIALVRKHGYRSCVTALPGRMEPGHPLLEMRRCGLSPAWPVLAVRKRVHE